jgi:hypothetical protein
MTRSALRAQSLCLVMRYAVAAHSGSAQLDFKKPAEERLKNNEVCAQKEFDTNFTPCYKKQSERTV